MVEVRSPSATRVAARSSSTSTASSGSWAGQQEPQRATDATRSDHQGQQESELGRERQALGVLALGGLRRGQALENPEQCSATQGASAGDEWAGT